MNLGNAWHKIKQIFYFIFTIFYYASVNLQVDSIRTIPKIDPDFVFYRKHMNIS